MGGNWSELASIGRKETVHLKRLSIGAIHLDKTIGRSVLDE